MIYPEGLDPITADGELFFRLGQLDKMNGERQLRRNDAKSCHYPLQALWPEESERFRAFRISHGKQKARQSADVIPVKMGKADHIDGFKAPALFLDGDLRSLSAVDEKAASVISRHQRCQPAIGQRHHTAASK